MLKWLWLSALVIVVDQLTKGLATAYLEPYHAVPVAPFLNLTLMYNPGAAFSFLSSASGWQRWFFVLIALGVSAVLIVWLRRLDSGERWTAIALALVLGGALGNVWDRLWLGHVVDFIDLYVGEWHWPAFNVADAAITVGAAMLILEALRDSSGAGVARRRHSR